MNLSRLYELLKDSEAEPWLETLQSQVDASLSDDANGKLKEWRSAIAQLPVISSSNVELTTAAVTVNSESVLSDNEKDNLKSILKLLMPWRKGPYHIHGIEIDTEWRSDYKWDRLITKITPLKGRRVLDVGCGNGYHSWRVLGEGAELVIGIDPSPLFIMQFTAIKHFVGEKDIFVLPLGIEDVPANLQAFDSVFSMGVLYHRKSPIDHFYQLRECLRPGGELILETLVVSGDEHQVLIPEDRYAQMRNVWFIPSSKAIMLWLKRCGFKNIKLVDETCTSLEEQRSTEWMQFHSLKEFLDPEDMGKTIEGYPAPLRAVFTAEAP